MVMMLNETANKHARKSTNCNEKHTLEEKELDGERPCQKKELITRRINNNELVATDLRHVS